MTVNEIIALARRYAAQNETARQTLANETLSLRRNLRRVSDARSCQSILQTVAKDVQESVHKQISTIVTRCLQAVFDDPYKFKVVFDKKRGKTEAKLVFVRRGLKLDPVDGCGGGVLDVAAFALRLACLIIQKPHKRRLLVLDEPFRFLSERNEYRSRVRDLLMTLSREMKVQIITVTHDPVLEIGKVIEIK